MPLVGLLNIIHANGGVSAAGAGSYSSAVLEDSPLRYYKLDEASGLPQDSGSNGSHILTVTGAPTYGETSLVGGDGNSISFNGATPDLFEASRVTYNGLNAGIEFVFKRTGIPSALEVIYEQYHTGATQGGLLAGINDAGQVYCGGKGIGTGAFKANFTTANFCDGNPHHVFINITAGVVEIFVDGSSEAMTNANFTGTIITGPTDLAIGSSRYLAIAPSLPFTGHIDEWAGYYNPLSSARIAAHAAAGGF